jgi:hypothetical protein
LGVSTSYRGVNTPNDTPTSRVFWGYRMFSYGQIDTINLPKHQCLQVDMFINVKGKWCPEEDSNLHVHTDTST